MGRGGVNQGYNPEQMGLRKQYAQTLVAIIRSGVESGEFACEDPANFSRGLLGMLNWMSRWYDPAGAKPAAEIAEVYANTILLGLSR